MNNNDEKIEKVTKSKKSRIEHGTKLSKGCWMCDICGYEGRDRTTIKIHIKTHSKKHKYTCTRCCYSFKNAKSLNDHISVAHLNSSIDKEPQFSQNQDEPEKWNNSTLIYEDNGTEEDSGTEKSSSKKSEKIEKVRKSKIKHGTKQGKHGNSCWMCDICGFKASGLFKIQRHIQIHTNKKHKFTCTRCSYAFKNAKSLNDHISIAHLNSSNDKETEEDCSQNQDEPEKWENEDNMTEENSETEKSISPEPNNDIKPVTVRILNYNLTDTGEHVCPECGAVIKNRKHFTRHWNKHIGVKFRCDHCGADFSRRDKLQEHTREKHEGSNNGKSDASPTSTGESKCDKSSTDEEN